MAKSKTTWQMMSWGIYTDWDRNSKNLPKIKKMTFDIPASLGIEFGYILRIKKGKGKKINFRIEHPPFPDKNGETAPPFSGDLYIRSNDWHFFLGDTVWEPVHDKVGAWRLIAKIEGETVADKTFTLFSEED